MVHRNIHDPTTDKALEHDNGLTVLGFNFHPPEMPLQEAKPMADVSPARQNEGMDFLTTIIKSHLKKPGSKFQRKDLLKLVSGLLKIVRSLEAK